MKKVFYRKDIEKYNECYSDKAVKKIVDMISNGDDTINKGTILDILNVKYPLIDKYWFIYNHCDLNRKQMADSIIFAAQTALLHYDELNPDDGYIENILDILRDSYTNSKRLNTVMASYQDGLQDIVTQSENDTKYIAIGMIHMVDAVHSLNEEAELNLIVNHMNSALSYFIKGLVSREDLKLELINYWKEIFK
jgi:hypothetical protein